MARLKKPFNFNFLQEMVVGGLNGVTLEIPRLTPTGGCHRRLCFPEG